MYIYIYIYIHTLCTYIIYICIYTVYIFCLFIDSVRDDDIPPIRTFQMVAKQKLHVNRTRPSLPQ